MSQRKIILFSPDIRKNAGNIARTCAVTRTRLCLVRPLGFNLSDRQIKRAGLDYWDSVDIEIFDSLESAIDGPVYFFSTHGKQIYTEVVYEENACFIFGSETKGLPPWVHEKWHDRFFKIPMAPESRSLNLSNAAAIVLYEALRQSHFKPLEPSRS